MTRLTPWWETVRLRDEIVSASGAIEDVQMSLFNAVHSVAGREVPYSEAQYYGEITYPSPSLVALMAQIAVRIGAGDGYQGARALWRLDQGMGGGKSHGLIGLWHLVSHTKEFAATEIGRQAFAEAEKIVGKGGVPQDLNRPVCIVLSCDNMTPGKGDKSLDGPAETLGERFLWRLFDGRSKIWNQYREHTGNKEKLAEAINAAGAPVLILVDEVLDYVRAASALEDNRLLMQDMSFLRALLDTVNDVPNCAMVLVMIASDKDHIVLSDLGRRCREELDDLLVRNGRTEAVTSANDFAEIIRRRLIEAPPVDEVVSKTAEVFDTSMEGAWHKRVFSRLGWATQAEFRRRVSRSYPFHPSLIDLAEKEWSLSAGFQRVRSTIQIFSAGLWAQQQRATSNNWAPLLIGPGDLLLSASDVREALLNSGLIPDQRTVSNYREIASTEVVADDDQRGTARTLDRQREDSGYAKTNPRAAERQATALFVYSIGQRPQGRRGATEAEILAASFVPSGSFGTGDSEVVLAELREPETGLAALEELPGRGGQPARFLVSTRQTLNMLIRAQRNAISDVERDAELADAAERLSTTGPFRDKIFVSANEKDSRGALEILEQAGFDDARSTRLLILDPRRFSLLNGADSETREAICAALGIGSRKLPVGWASSAVFCLVNTQRRAHARKLATEYLARRRVTDIEAVRADEDLLRKAKNETKEALARCESAVKAAYQHIVYLAEENGGRTDRAIRFDKEGQSSLDGSIVWAALCDRDKAFGLGEFTGKALVHNLRDSDWGRPLAEIRDAFWNTPRLPLLPEGEPDLRRAVFEILRTGAGRLVDKDGNERTATSPGEINLASSGVRLARPEGGEGDPDSILVPNLIGKARREARLILEAAGFKMEGEGDGLVVGQEPPPATAAQKGDVIQLKLSAEEATPTEYQVAVTLNKSLGDHAVRDSVRLFLSALSAVTDENASHIQLTVRITTPANKKDELVEKGEAAGGSTSVIEV